jgi:prolyl-tRNA editing enzyme YbaK/EbsC (Cys-tRNA(Pro) deacylase)
MTNFKTLVGQFLKNYNIVFEEIQLQNPVHSVLDVTNVCLCSENEVLKTMVLTGSQFNLIVVLKGNDKIEKTKLEKLFNQKITFATKEKVLEYTGFEVGTVSPIIVNENSNLVLYADKKILFENNFIIGSGINNILIRISKDEFLKIFKGNFIDI